MTRRHVAPAHVCYFDATSPYFTTVSTFEDRRILGNSVQTTRERLPAQGSEVSLKISPLELLTMKKISNQRFALDPLACLLMLMACMNPAWSMEFTGHHGGVVTNCKDPEFYHETPAPNAKVKLLETFSFIASENTMTESLEVAVNLEPVKTQIRQNGNGTFTVEARITPPKTEGRAWIRVTGHSDDGCQQLHTWDIFISPDGI